MATTTLDPRDEMTAAVRHARGWILADALVLGLGAVGAAMLNQKPAFVVACIAGAGALIIVWLSSKTHTVKWCYAAFAIVIGVLLARVISDGKATNYDGLQVLFYIGATLALPLVVGLKSAHRAEALKRQLEDVFS